MVKAEIPVDVGVRVGDVRTVVLTAVPPASHVVLPGLVVVPSPATTTTTSSLHPNSSSPSSLPGTSLQFKNDFVFRRLITSKPMPLEVTGTYSQEIGNNENVNWMESEFSVCHGVAPRYNFAKFSKKQHELKISLILMVNK